MHHSTSYHLFIYIFYSSFHTCFHLHRKTRALCSFCHSLDFVYMSVSPFICLSSYLCHTPPWSSVIAQPSLSPFLSFSITSLFNAPHILFWEHCMSFFLFQSSPSYLSSFLIRDDNLIFYERPLYHFSLLYVVITSFSHHLFLFVFFSSLFWRCQPSY